jgi:hypothetical protein
MRTLVVDTGQDLVGVFFVEEERYVPYRGYGIAEAVKLIQAADEVITYNGKDYDLEKLGDFVGIVGDLPLSGVHSDSQQVPTGIVVSPLVHRVFTAPLFVLFFSRQPRISGSNENPCDWKLHRRKGRHWMPGERQAG